MTDSKSSPCPRCGEPIPENAPSGLCPACVLAGVIPTVGASLPSMVSPPPSIDELAGHFPDLEILELVGAGGMGAVYKARQPKLDRHIALKILHASDDPAFEERFHREARVLARLSHPNIVAVFDFGTAGPFHYLVMEYVDGVNLRQAMQTGRFSPAEALTLVQEMCAALKAAHNEGILHRDIKPENILLDSRGSLKVADFGIAKMIGAKDLESLTLTRQNSILGSPQYMAPEQIESPDDVDQRADIYSLGVVFYELLTGELPLGRFAPPSNKSEIDARIDDIVFRTLEKEREARFQTAEEMSQSVDTLSQAPPPLPAKFDSGEPEVARFATLSSVLTGISVPIVIYCLTAFLSVRQVSSSDPEPQTNYVLLTLAILSVIFSIITPPTGFFLGSHALREIRNSNGRKGGLSRGTFAILTWPILFSVALVSSFLPGPIAMMIHALILLASLLAFCWALVPPVRRWARNEAKSLSPVLWRFLLVMVIFFIIALMLPSLFGSMNGQEERDGPDGVERVEQTSRSDKLIKKLDAAWQLPSGYQRAVAIASVAESAAIAGETEVVQLACGSIREGGEDGPEPRIEKLADDTRAKCALILARQGLTRAANVLAAQITSESRRKEVMLKIANEDF